MRFGTYLIKNSFEIYARRRNFDPADEIAKRSYTDQLDLMEHFIRRLSSRVPEIKQYGLDKPKNMLNLLKRAYRSELPRQINIPSFDQKPKELANMDQAENQELIDLIYDLYNTLVEIDPNYQEEKLSTYQFMNVLIFKFYYKSTDPREFTANVITTKLADKYHAMIHDTTTGKILADKLIDEKMFKLLQHIDIIFE